MTQGSKTTTINSKVMVAVHDYDDDDLWGGRLSEMDSSEAVTAYLSPLKNGAQVMGSVSNIFIYLLLLLCS